MQTKIFDGRAAATKIKEELKNEAQGKGLRPNLAVVLAGEDQSSLSYIKQKRIACETLGWSFELRQLPTTASFEEIKKTLLILNSEFLINGVILQLPLPLPNPEYELTTFILPGKDIDGLGPQSQFTPPTALAVAEVLERENIKIEGRRAVILGRGATAGKPVADLLFKRGAKIYVIHSQTDPGEARAKLLEADLVVSCVGQANLVTGKMIKEGAVVIGVGLSRLSAGGSQPEAGSRQLIGDLDETSLMGRARLITPTPGGVGPLTVAFLLKNLLKAAQINKK